MYNALSFNPAYAGSREVISIFGLHRNQWMTLEGAPITSQLSIHMPVKLTNLGLGGSINHDYIGPTQFINANFNVSYGTYLTKTWRLVGGLRVDYDHFSINPNRLDIYDIDDPKFQSKFNQFSPNLGLGLFSYSEKFYFGFSIPQLLKKYRFDNETIQLNQTTGHFYAIGGYVFDLTKKIKLKPAFLAKKIKQVPLQVDFSLSALFYDKFSIGGAYRNSKAFSALAGFQINKAWMIGYAYDLESTNLINYNSGSHELFLRYEFDLSTRISSPRFF